MGSVWIAEDLHLGRRVALKFLSQKLLVVNPAYDPKTILHKLDAPYGLQSPKFTPDGKAIAFLLTRNRATNIWKSPLSGSAPSVLTKNSRFRAASRRPTSS